MVNEPNKVRDAILRRLRTEQEVEVVLVNFLAKMTRYMLKMSNCGEEVTRMHLLPLDQPVNNFGLQTLLMT